MLRGYQIWEVIIIARFLMLRVLLHAAGVFFIPDVFFFVNLVTMYWKLIVTLVPYKTYWEYKWVTAG